MIQVFTATVNYNLLFSLDQKKVLFVALLLLFKDCLFQKHNKAFGKLKKKPPKLLFFNAVLFIKLHYELLKYFTGSIDTLLEKNKKSVSASTLV